MSADIRDQHEHSANEGGGGKSDSPSRTQPMRDVRSRQSNEGDWPSDRSRGRNKQNGDDNEEHAGLTYSDAKPCRDVIAHRDKSEGNRTDGTHRNDTGDHDQQRRQTRDGNARE